MKRDSTDVLGLQAPKTWMELPKDVTVKYSYWEFLDEIGSWFLQGAAVVAGGPYSAASPGPSGEINITSPGGIEIFFPMWGTKITVNDSSDFDVPCGNQIILISDIEYPVQNGNRNLKFVEAGEDVQKLGQFCFFLGGRQGDSVYLRPDSKV